MNNTHPSTHLHTHFFKITFSGYIYIIERWGKREERVVVVVIVSTSFQIGVFTWDINMGREGDQERGWPL
jgi:hypothetical protein